MKKSFFILLFFIFVLTGCSLTGSGKKSAKLTFFIDSQAVAKIRATALHSREAETLDEDEKVEEKATQKLFVEISILGDYVAKQTIPLTENASVSFYYLKQGLQVYAQGSVYYLEKIDDKTEQRVDLYAGKTDTITLQPGDNVLKLVFNRVETAYGNALFTIVQSEYSDIDVAVLIDGNEFTGSGTILADDETSLLFEPDDSYTNYTWKINGEEITSASAIAQVAAYKLIFNLEDCVPGVVYDITLLASKADSASEETVYHSYSAQIKKN